MITITKDNIEETIKNGITLCKFGAPWCSPCRQLVTIIEKLSEDFKDNDSVTIADCDVDNDQELAMKYGIRSIPTTIIFKDGKVVDTIMGVESKSVLTEKLNSLN